MLKKRAPGDRSRRLVVRLGVAAGLVALAAYATLKTVWGLGSHVGVRDVTEWDAAFAALTELELWLAFWGTVVLDVAGAVLLLVVAASRRTPFGRGGWRAPLRGLAWVGAGALAVFAVVALGSTVLSDVRVAAGVEPPGPLSSWVFYLVYSSFLVYAVALGAATWVTRDPHDSAAPVTAP